MDQETEILQEVNKNSKMGMEALNTIIKKAEDGEFKSLLNTQSR